MDPKEGNETEVESRKADDNQGLDDITNEPEEAETETLEEPISKSKTNDNNNESSSGSSGKLTEEDMAEINRRIREVRGIYILKILFFKII